MAGPAGGKRQNPAQARHGTSSRNPSGAAAANAGGPDGSYFAEFVAKAAIGAGITIEQALDYSLARLKLTAKVLRRDRAEQALVLLNCMTAAVAASNSKEGCKMLERVRKALLKDL